MILKCATSPTLWEQPAGSSSAGPLAMAGMVVVVSPLSLGPAILPIVLATVPACPLLTHSGSFLALFIFRGGGGEALRPKMTELKVTGNDPMSGACIRGLEGVAATC